MVKSKSEHVEQTQRSDSSPLTPDSASHDAGRFANYYNTAQGGPARDPAGNAFLMQRGIVMTDEYDPEWDRLHSLLRDREADVGVTHLAMGVYALATERGNALIQRSTPERQP